MKPNRGTSENTDNDTIPHAGRTGEVFEVDAKTKGRGRAPRSVALPDARQAEEKGSQEQPFGSKSKRSPRAIPTVLLVFHFQPNYERLLIALISGVVCFGLTPIIIPQDRRSKWRMSKIKQLSVKCQFSLHDLSPVAGGRLNMAFELGIVIGATKQATHEWFILVNEAYRLQRSISDLNGIDPAVHSGTESGMLFALRKIFKRKGITPKVLRNVLQSVRKSYRELRAEGYRAAYEDMDCFNRLILTARIFLAAELEVKERV